MLDLKKEMHSQPGLIELYYAFDFKKNGAQKTEVTKVVFSQ